MTYKHDALVRLWLEGKPIEYLDGTMWVPLPHPDQAKKMPHFYPQTEYRPRVETKRFRVALLRDYVAVVQTLEDEVTVAKRSGFTRWLTDWMEYQA